MKLFILVAVVAIAATLLHPVSRNGLKFAFWLVSYSGPRTHGSVTHQGAAITYRCYGNGPYIVLLHGGLSNSFDWFSQIPFLINHGLGVVLIDTRGHGLSTIGDAALTYRQFAEDVVVVLDRLDITSAIFIGWSDGGNTILRLAEKYPERVDRMVLISANYSPRGLQDPELLAFESGWTGKLKRWILGSNDPNLVDDVRNLWMKHPRLTPDDLKPIAVPTLVLIGENDAITVRHAMEMSNALPDAKLEVLKGARHHALMTNADEVNSLVQQFIGDDDG